MNFFKGRCKGVRLLALALGSAALLWAPFQAATAEPAGSQAVAAPKAVVIPGSGSNVVNKPKPAGRSLSGAELYSIHCNRCHPERYPTERTAAQWKTIMLHMRVRANLPGQQAQTILKYLQDNSGR